MRVPARLLPETGTALVQATVQPGLAATTIATARLDLNVAGIPSCGFDASYHTMIYPFPIYLSRSSPRLDETFTSIWND